jgi:acetoin utilization deacetylase AcuC-like enzyme
VSAGYDGRLGDPLGDLRYSTASFRWMAAQLTALVGEVGAAGPLCFLEGGYTPSLVAESIVATLRGLTDGSPGLEHPISDNERAEVETTINELRPFWKGVL